MILPREASKILLDRLEQMTAEEFERTARLYSPELLELTAPDAEPATRNRKHTNGSFKRSDLMRVKGIGCDYADLLDAAGIETVSELATRRADSLYERLRETNERAKLVRRPPSAAEIERWVAEAKTLAG